MWGQYILQVPTQQSLPLGPPAHAPVMDSHKPLCFLQHTDCGHLRYTLSHLLFKRIGLPEPPISFRFKLKPLPMVHRLPQPHLPRPTPCSLHSIPYPTPASLLSQNIQSILKFKGLRLLETSTLGAIPKTLLPADYSVESFISSCSLTQEQPPPPTSHLQSGLPSHRCAWFLPRTYGSLALPE